MTASPSPLAILLLANLLHEAAREATNDEQPGSFVEFADLSASIQKEYASIAGNLLDIVEPYCPAFGSTPKSDAVDWLARHISDAAKAAGDNDREGVDFDGMSVPAQAFRRKQATYLLSRFGFQVFAGKVVAAA